MHLCDAYSGTPGRCEILWNKNKISEGVSFMMPQMRHIYDIESFEEVRPSSWFDAELDGFGKNAKMRIIPRYYKIF